MNEHSPIRKRGSLLERASELYDFRRAMPAPGPVAPEAKAPAAPAARPAPVSPAPVGFVPQPAAPVAEPAYAPARFRGREGVVDFAILRDLGFIVPDAPVNALSEEFRIVKRQLLLTASGGFNGKPLPRGRMILVCSAQPNEGKTFCAVNLALSLAAERDVEVLLVDGDFAKPEIPAMLGLESGPGLMDALADPDLDVETCVIRTDIPNFSVLPAGRQSNNDTEHLASARTRAVLEALLANPARVVILDSPPALAASPASVLALHAGQVLMIVRADQTSETDLRAALALLNGCDTIQLLLNGTRLNTAGQRFGSYYGYGD